MADFIYVYHGGKRPDTPEEGEKVMAAWQAWMGGMGDKLKNPGNPVGMSKTVHGGGVDDNGGANPVSGFTIVSADSFDEAVDMAKGCPIMDDGGSVEVAELFEM